MRYDDFRRSDNIDDRRDDSGGGMGGGGGFGISDGRRWRSRHRHLIVLGLIGWAVGIDPRILIGGAEILTGGQQQAPTIRPTAGPAPPKQGAPKDEMGSMIAGVLGEIDDRWTEIFQASGQTYTRAAHRAVPQRDQWRTLRHGAVGDGAVLLSAGPADFPRHRILPRSRDPLPRMFGQCLQIHRGLYHRARGRPPHPEPARHPAKARQMQQQAGSKAEANSLQVMVELQADCLSGVWVNREEKKRPDFLEAGDIDAALQTASAIGDDTLQRQAQGRVVPNSFTHGSAEQRKRWFMTGYPQGSVQACNTFAPGVQL